MSLVLDESLPRRLLVPPLGEEEEDLVWIRGASIGPVLIQLEGLVEEAVLQLYLPKKLA